MRLVQILEKKLVLKGKQKPPKENFKKLLAEEIGGRIVFHKKNKKIAKTQIREIVIG